MPFPLLRHQSDKVIVNINLLCGILATINTALIDFNTLNEFMEDFGYQLFDVCVFLYNFEESFYIDGFSVWLSISCTSCSILTVRICCSF